MFNKHLLTLIAISFLFSASAFAEATHQELLKLVKESNSYITQNGKKALRKMTKNIQKKWRKGNSYIFVVDCKSGATLVHAKKSVIGMNLLNSMKDKKTGRYFLKEMCQKSKTKPKGVWHTYWWAKPNESKPSRKVSFIMRNDRYPKYMLGSGIYSETLDMKTLPTN